MNNRILKLIIQHGNTKTMSDKKGALIIFVALVILMGIFALYMDVLSKGAEYEEIQKRETVRFLQIKLQRMEKELELLKTGGIGIQTNGKASFYDYDLKGYPGYSKYNLTAASRDIPRGSKARVCVSGGDCVEVRINDYGPEKCPAEYSNCYL